MSKSEIIELLIRFHYHADEVLRILDKVEEGK